MKPIRRVKKIISYLGISISAFEKSVGLSNNSIQTAIKRNSNLKDETLNSILSKYTEVSPEWLLTGEGEMLKKGAVSVQENAEIGELKDKIIKLYERIEELSKKNEELAKQNKMLQDAAANKIQNQNIA